MTIQKSTVVFGKPATEEHHHIMVHNLSPELTKEQLMPYVRDIATDNSVNVEQIDMFPTLMGYVLFATAIGNTTCVCEGVVAY